MEGAVTTAPRSGTGVATPVRPVWSRNGGSRDHGSLGLPTLVVVPARTARRNGGSRDHGSEVGVHRNTIARWMRPQWREP